MIYHKINYISHEHNQNYTKHANRNISKSDRISLKNGCNFDVFWF